VDAVGPKGMTYGYKLACFDIQNLDTRIASHTHEWVSAFSLRPYDAVVVQLQGGVELVRSSDGRTHTTYPITRRAMLSTSLFILEPAQDLDGVILAQHASAYDGLDQSVYAGSDTR